MSFLNETIIPGNHGKIFGTNAESIKDLENIKERILELEGIKEVSINFEIFPREFTVQTSKMVKVAAVEKQVNAVGFHSIPKETFKL
jgi:hypothetical protein